jgi:hypothetical protein
MDFRGRTPDGEWPGSPNAHRTLGWDYLCTVDELLALQIKRRIAFHQVTLVGDIAREATHIIPKSEVAAILRAIRDISRMIPRVLVDRTLVGIAGSLKGSVWMIESFELHSETCCRDWETEH